MGKLSKIIKTLEQSLEEKNFDKFFSQLDKDKKIAHLKFEKNKLTLLHKLCTINTNLLKNSSDEDIKLENDNSSTLSDTLYTKMLERFIKDYEVNVDTQDSDGNTPLHYAAASGNGAAVKTLLKYDAQLELENKKNSTPLAIASYQGFKEIEKLLLEASHFQIGNTQIPASFSIKEYQDHQKKTVLNLGPLRVLNTQKPTPIEAIESVVYTENSTALLNLHDQLKQLYLDPTLCPMIEILGLYAHKGVLSDTEKKDLFKKREEFKKVKENPEFKNDTLFIDLSIANLEKKIGKKFKVLAFDRNDLTSFKVFSPEPLGLFTGKNSIFIATKNVTLEEIVATLMHEATHFLMTKLFNNEGKPFPKSNPYLKKAFILIVGETKEKLETIKERSQDVLDQQAYEIIATVYSKYHQDEWPQELIARVPQIIAILGPKKGTNWLENNIPNLINFYRDKVNKEISQFLISNKVEDYLEIEENKNIFSSKLNF